MPQFDTTFFSSLVFWEIVSFLILLWVLYKFAFPPILDALETRERKIKESLDQAERSRTEAERKLREYEAKLNAAAQESEGILAQAKEKAHRMLEENEQRMREEAERIRSEALEEIERERRRTMQELRTQTADLALLVAERVLTRSIRDEDHKRMAEEALQAVSASHQNGRG